VTVLLTLILLQKVSWKKEKSILRKVNGIN
jgi:hypothetical protein